MLLNIDDSVRTEIFSRIEAGDVDPLLFSKAEKDVQHFLIYGMFMEWDQGNKAQASRSGANTLLSRVRRAFAKRRAGDNQQEMDTVNSSEP